MGALGRIFVAVGFLSGECRNQNIFENGALRQEMMRLKDQADGMVAKGRQLVVVELRQILSIQRDDSAVGAIQCADDVEQSAFARAGRSDNGKRFARFDSERDVFENGQCRSIVGRRITFADVDEFE